jgi:beta-carotene 3-hydroxylase
MFLIIFVAFVLPKYVIDNYLLFAFYIIVWGFYGVAYFLVHDVFVHQRFPWLKNTNRVYFKAMRFAHKIHHKVNEKDGAEAFGFLFVSKKYLDKYRQKK